MNAKTLGVLIVLAVAALIAAIWIDTANAPVSDAADRDRPLFAQLRGELNRVDAFGVSGAGGKPLVTLKREGDLWRVIERDGYPADVAKLREYLLKLADASVLENKTANPARYAALGVEDVAAPEAKSLLVTLGGLAKPVKLLIGIYSGQGGGTFVRREGEAQSLLVKGNLLADRNPAAWIKHEIADIDATRIAQVSIADPDGKTLRVYKEHVSEANFRIADVPKGREPISDFIANSLGAGLSNLKADDVAAAKEAPAPAKAYKVRYLGFGGLVVEVTAWDSDGKPRAQFVAANDAARLDADIAASQARERAAYDNLLAQAKQQAIDAKADEAGIAKAQAEVPKPGSLLDLDKDRADRQVAAVRVVEDLNKAFAGWTFVLPAYEFANFDKRIDDLLKPAPTKPAGAGAAAAKSPASSTREAGPRAKTP